MAIIKQTDSRTGITYAYETQYFWDKKKKQSRTKRKIVGKVDSDTGEIVPTRGRKTTSNNKSDSNSEHNQSHLNVEKKSQHHPINNKHTQYLYYGATYLLDSFSKQLGLVDDLKRCFPETYKQILSIAYYLILEDKNPLYRFEKWHLTHLHPFAQNITSPRSSELFFEIAEDESTIVKYREDQIRKGKRYLGYFALISNDEMHAFEALDIYRQKDVVEKAFGNYKERLNMRRLLVSSERNLEGKLFIEFVALILISHLNHKMKEANLYSKYTVDLLLDKLDVIACFFTANKPMRVGEVLSTQREIYCALGVEPPSSYVNPRI